MGTQLPSSKRGYPQFPAHVYCGQMAGWIMMPLGTEVGLGPGHVVLDGDPASPKKGTQPPIFRPYLLWPNGWMDQDAAWWDPLKIVPLHGRGPSDIVLDRDPAPLPQKGAQPPIFGRCLLWPNSWMDQDATWLRRQAWPRPHCARLGPSSPRKKEHSPNFWPMSVMAKRLDGCRCHLVGRWASA